MIRRAIVLILAGAVGLAGTAWAGTYSGGTGEPNNPYRIATAEDLNDIGNHVEDFNKCFVMVNDINLADYTGTMFNIIGDFSDPFIGVFDGNGHTIDNFSWSVPSGYVRCVGVFGVVGTIDSNDEAIGEVRNVRLYNADVNASDSSDFVGSLVGFDDFGTIVNCYTRGSVSGGVSVGGLAGYNWRGIISDSHSDAVSSGDSGVGGLVGSNASGTVIECYSAGMVWGTNWAIGGVVGSNGWIVRRSLSTATVSGAKMTGGLVGENSYGRLEDSYCKGSVSGTQYVGGLAGWNHGNSIITRCYSTGHVEGANEVGGLVGDQQFGSPSVEDSFWDVETSGQAASDGGEGKTTLQMQTETTFIDAGWDFIEIWNIGENQTYPFLRVHPAGDLNHDGLVDWRDFAILASHWLEGTGP